jgi:pantetheine-phosphate adenylyltransferase
MAARKKVRPAEQRRGLYPGSFDPVTRGHLDVIVRASRLFDRLYVGVVDNPSKAPLFTAQERAGLIRKALGDVSNVEVVTFSGLTVDLAARLGARWLVRGIRSSSDLGFEASMAHSNRICGPGLKGADTIFLASSPFYSFISSTLVKEIAAGGGDFDFFVPPAVAKALRRKFSRSGKALPRKKS